MNRFLVVGAAAATRHSAATRHPWKSQKKDRLRSHAFALVVVTTNQYQTNQLILPTDARPPNHTGGHTALGGAAWPSASVSVEAPPSRRASSHRGLGGAAQLPSLILRFCLAMRTRNRRRRFDRESEYVCAMLGFVHTVRFENSTNSASVQEDFSNAPQCHKRSSFTCPSCLVSSCLPSN